MLKRRTILCVITTAVLAMAAALPQLAWAQTPCGAMATGKSQKDGRPIVGAFKDQRVSADGHWEMCTTPTATAPQPDCKAQGPGGKWFKASPGFQGGWCEPAAGQSLPTGMLGQQQAIADHAGSVRGIRTFTCQVRADGSKGWAATAATCAQIK